jgi:RimJ/RimL family protein N-acetyltransferase
MAEDDWDNLLRWYNDPEVLYFSEGDDVSSRSLEEIQGIYRGVSREAFCFIIELEGKPVGECWLQRMNLARILAKYPGLDLRRIDLAIGEKGCWGQGIGTETIRLLTEFGFVRQAAEMIFGLVGDYNARSQAAFRKVGYELVGTSRDKPGHKATYELELAITKARFFNMRADCS